jgi:glyoxylase-like metal-dependent hydrolase (beta-lactamase superfamily II)
MKQSSNRTAMTKIHHINCGTLQAAEDFTVVCHCLLLEDKTGLALIDAGIGVADVRDPVGRIGQELIHMSGFRFNMDDTAVVQLAKLGFRAGDVKHIVISHLDPDHIGGLADFPNATVHVGQEEYNSFSDGHFRHRPVLLSHGPTIITYNQSEERWFGLEARKVALGFETNVYLVPLFGHTVGHCGIAVRQEAKWILYAGDAYYLRDELFVQNHPVDAVAAANAMDNSLRLESLEKLRHLAKNHPEQIELFGYHDPTELRQ